MNILFDIGGTKMRIALSRSDDAFEIPIIFETPKSYDDGLVILKREITNLSQGAHIDAIYGGIAGPVHKDGYLISSPNLSEWIGKNIKHDLESAFHTHAHVVNDSALVGLGEAHNGAGRGHEIVAYITVSTGVGGARIVRGEIDIARVGFEPGHQIVDLDGSLQFRPGECQLERFISGRAVSDVMKVDPAEINDENFWKQQSKILAAGIANTIVFWSPDIVVLGGSMMNKIGISTESVKHYLPGYLTIFPDLPAIVKSELGDMGGIYGALALARRDAYNKTS